MSNEETFLESFIEHISTLPHEVRRNLELIKELDKSSSQIIDELREAEESYIKQAEKKLRTVPLSSEDNKPEQSSSRVSSGGVVVPVAKENEEQKNAVVVPTTEEMINFISNPASMLQIASYRQTAKQQAEEKVSIAEQTYALVDDAVKRLDSDLEKFETALKGNGEFEASTGAKPNDLAAIQVAPNSQDWILAKVITHNPETGMYKLSDEDTESNKIFNLPESQVVILGGIDRLAKGDKIFAVYPDTTSFYQATVVQAPRKISGGGPFVMVHFKDDGDEHGITHDKAVLMKHVMRVPFLLP